MAHNIPQNPAAERALAELRAMSFEEIMALPVSSEAGAISQALTDMNRIVSERHVQEPALVSQFGRINSRSYLVDKPEISAILLSCCKQATIHMDMAEQWQRIAA